MSNFLKKNWFVMLVVLVFTGISIYYIYDTNKGKLAGKSINGEDVVYAVSDENVTASDFYDELYRNSGSDTMLSLFEKAVAEAGVETTNELKENAASQAASIIANFQSNYGSSYMTNLNNALADTGYDDLETYLLTMLKMNELTAQYAKTNFDDLKIRSISYILINYEDPDNKKDTPTDDEKARMKAVDDALKAGTFADAAIAFSEDSSTASTGGVLGVIDRNTSSLDSAFLEASLALNEGEISDWVKSDNFGYFRIMCTAATPETLEANVTDSNPYMDLVSYYDTSLTNKAVWAKAQELGVDFKGDEAREKAIKGGLGVEEE